MHHLGEKVFTDHYAANGTFIASRNRVDFWDNDAVVMQSEANTHSFAPYSIHPGDELQTHCFYNTMGQARPVRFGSRSHDEMCAHMVYYFPHQVCG